MCLLKHPELFPSEMSKGYKCIGYCETSKKMPKIRIRRIKLKGEKAPYQVST